MVHCICFGRSWHHEHWATDSEKSPCRHRSSPAREATTRVQMMAVRAVTTIAALRTLIYSSSR
ncbi:hypothetical protein C8Q70DRAFT_273085 [Cubamyces menziesii]|nr:hypothetical protein C8Q70DRAFT_273085 [Cubamyces menziesii]